MAMLMMMMMMMMVTTMQNYEDLDQDTWMLFFDVVMLELLVVTALQNRNAGFFQNILNKNGNTTSIAILSNLPGGDVEPPAPSDRRLFQLLEFSQIIMWSTFIYELSWDQPFCV